MKVLFLPEVRQYFVELASILYQKDYFGFEENAIRYARELFDDIENSLPEKQKKKAPEYFSKYGDNLSYAVFKKNNTTQWYVFFETYVQEKAYVVTYIGNNHTIVQYL
ncbi:hypothetical protein M2451_002960 [Dysgonomonas sp. PFB1-18]|uniref:hypothetical protein n=1 Tax=unclassified Dysgonomonas TaxID=2630389 RepID=UPI0013CF7BE0|nr:MULTISPECIES: hypothetical protein [unclassified Dysgonomonas]MDH6310070.1 hypothetical protein [Dysgonomonas sp. PF1-14]MDH6339979.1 hypothetical protein [Dysgonomonas sp. PF1-16]MDH6381627.1 hypothetical protein [Dysgonomonas sp. PFB1-18]MDH6398735.1 hypothetical protein [Dysgonomonas sp. PF1-23]NDV93582.1 hypothetical protein [Dysgonomonas sp. 521]